MYLIKDLYQQNRQSLSLEVITGEEGLNRKLKKPAVHRPGLSLAGYLKSFISKRLLLFGKEEMSYLRALDEKIRFERLNSLLTDDTPAVFITHKAKPPKAITAICRKKNIPLFVSSMKTMHLMTKLILILNEKFSPSVGMHATLVEVFGVGVLLQGESSVGKSEAALGLLERGHRLISDDVVQVKKRDESLLGSGPDLTRYLMEIRGIGLINVANLYGATCVRSEKEIDLVIKMEEWDDRHTYDRVGLEDNFTDILGVCVPFHILPVKPGRDVILLIETIALNYRLKEMGYHSAKEFHIKLLDKLKNRRSRESYKKS